MRAPDERFSGYTDAQWAPIAEAIRAGLDLDPDQKWVVPGNRLPAFNQPEDALPESSFLDLRPALQQTVVFGLAHYRPSRQLATFRRLQRKSEDLRDLFRKYEQEHWGAALREIPNMLSVISRRLEAQIGRIPAKNSRAPNRLNTPRNHVMEELLRLWETLGGKPTGKAIENFMRACLEPIFGPTSERAVAHWLERYHAGEINF